MGLGTAITVAIIATLAVGARGLAGRLGEGQARRRHDLDARIGDRGGAGDRRVRRAAAHRLHGERTADGRLTEIVRPQFDRLAVRGAVAGMVPGIAIAMQRVMGRDAFFRDQSFPAPPASANNKSRRCRDRRSPCARLISAASAAAHSVQVNTPRSCSASVMAKACASHGSRNTGPSASRGMLGHFLRGAGCGGLVDHFFLSPAPDRAPRRRPRPSRSDRVGAPQFAAVEAHGVEPLRIFAGAERVAVGKNMAADDALDDAGMPAHITRQPRMRRRD